MFKQALPFIAVALALCTVSPSFGQERTRDAVRPSCDEAAALQGDCHESYGTTASSSYGGSVDSGSSNRPYVDFQTSDANFNTIMNKIGNDPSYCPSDDELRYVYGYEDAHPEISDAIHQNWINSSAYSERCPEAVNQ